MGSHCSNADRAALTFLQNPILGIIRHVSADLLDVLSGKRGLVTRRRSALIKRRKLPAPAVEQRRTPGAALRAFGSFWGRLEDREPYGDVLADRRNRGACVEELVIAERRRPWVGPP
jgi:hypothetical protein